MRKNELEFGLTIPQGGRGGDLPLEEENNPVKQYEFSKSISATAAHVLHEHDCKGTVIELPKVISNKCKLQL
jgi:hypothetical protein